MKFAAFTSIALSGSMAAAALQSLTEYTNDIPSCVVPYLPDALKSEGCDLTTIDASDFDCFCKHISAIAVILVGKVPATCSAGMLLPSRFRSHIFPIIHFYSNFV